MTLYEPLTDEMLAVFEEGDCEWPPMMRRLMWKERAHYKAEAERLQTLADEWKAVAILWQTATYDDD